MKSKIFLLLISLLISACGTQKENFSSIRACLDGIQEQTGESVKITGDNPNSVTGTLSNGNPFSCIQIVKKSGEIIYEGTFKGGKGKTKPTQLKGGKFSSMAICLKAIPKNSGSSINFIATDKPSIVSGKLANGEHFSCKKKNTGSQGTYYEGWYSYK